MQRLRSASRAAARTIFIAIATAFRRETTSLGWSRGRLRPYSLPSSRTHLPRSRWSRSRLRSGILPASVSSRGVDCSLFSRGNLGGDALEMAGRADLAVYPQRRGELAFGLVASAQQPGEPRSLLVDRSLVERRTATIDDRARRFDRS